MKSIKAALIVVLCLLGSVQAENEKYLRISVSGLNDARDPVCPVSLVYDLAQQQRLSGAYYIADTSCGITADIGMFGSDGLKFEMAFHLELRIDGQGTWLSGSVYALDYHMGGQGRPGERTSVQKKLFQDKKTLIGSCGLQDGRDVQLFATLTDHCPPNSPDCGENAVTLITSVTNQGRRFAHRIQARKLIAENMEFKTTVSPAEGDDGASELRYLTAVRVEGGTAGISVPVRRKIHFQRRYQIISRQAGDVSSSSTAVSYSSENAQEVVLEPGKELRLVFPPDKPSVEGFDIEDTLIILPR